MSFRKLRIAWSVGWGLAGVLVIVMWVRSYRAPTTVELIVTPRTRYYLHSVAGTIAVQRWHRTFAGREFMPIFNASSLPWLVTNAGIKIQRDSSRGIESLSISYWLVILGDVIVAFLPWLPFKRFSLRTLLIATTLVAVALGLIVWVC